MNDDDSKKFKELRKQAAAYYSSINGHDVRMGTFDPRKIRTEISLADLEDLLNQIEMFKIASQMGQAALLSDNLKHSERIDTFNALTGSIQRLNDWK